MSKKLSEYSNEEAAEMLCEILEPASEIFSDTAFLENMKKSLFAGATTALKTHGKEVVDILSIYDGIPREEYTVNPFQILTKLMALLKDFELIKAFTSQEQDKEPENSSCTPACSTIPTEI